MIYAGVNGYLDPFAVNARARVRGRPADAAAHQARRHPRRRSARPATSPTTTRPSSRAWSTATPRRSRDDLHAERFAPDDGTLSRDGFASRTCASASPRPRRRRRSPRPCRWSRRRSCAARRRRPKPRVPIAERMEQGAAASSRPRSAGSDSAPKLLAGTGSDQVHLLVVCTAERGLCGAFNSSIVRLARERANALIAEGKAVKILCVGRKGYDQLRRQYGKQIVEMHRAARRQAARLRARRQIAEKILGAVRATASSTSHAVLLALQVGDRADPDRAADHSAGVRGPAKPKRRRPPSTNTSRTKTKFSPSCCRAISRCRCSARCWKTPRPSRARA